MKKSFKIFQILIVIMIISNLSFSQLITIGTGTIQNSNTVYPAPYGNWYWGAKHQFLITASEIYAAGGGPGLINSLAFDVVTVNGVALANFEILIGATSITNLTTAFESGLTSVYSSASYTEISGWNTHVFSTPFVWDGASNIVVETCFNNTSYTNNAVFNQSTTSHSSSHEYHTDASGVCTSPGTGSTYTQRPNIQLNMIPLNIPINLGVISWDYPTEFCGLPSSMHLRTKIKNWGTDTVSNFDVSYSTDGGTIWETDFVSSSIYPDDTLEHVFSATEDFSASGIYTMEFAVSIAGDTMYYNDTLHNVQISNYHNINTFPFLEDFETGSTDYFNVKHNSNANAYIYDDGISYILRLEGRNPGGWTGSSTATTATNAWIDNITHHSSALSCNIDATIMTSLELRFDLKQLYSNYGPKYSWFRVLANGTQISDINGISDFNPITVDADPWETLRFDLQAYAGTIFTLEFQASNYYDKIYSNPGDNAFVDNIILQEKPADDAGVDFLISQMSGCGVSPAEDIVIQIKNYGNNAITGFDVAYQVDGGTIVVENIGATTLNVGDTYIYTFVTKADISVSGPHTIKSWTAMVPDTDYNNDTVFENVDVHLYTSVYPFEEDYETFPVGTGTVLPNGWTLSPISGYRWQTDIGTTSSTSTGPTVDHTTGTATGVYFYTEASSGTQEDLAYLISPCLDLSPLSNPELKFWYHMYGADIDTLFIDVFIGGVWIEDIYNIGGEQQIVTTDDWLEAIIDLTPYISLDKFRFRARRGPSFNGDICIDDINIFQVFDDDLVCDEWIEPEISSCSMSANENITTSVINNGLNPASNFNLLFSTDSGLTYSAPELVTSTLNADDTLIYTFTATADFLMPGVYYCFVVVDYVNDMFNDNDTLYYVINIDTSITTFPLIEDFETFIVGTPGTFQNGWEMTNQSTYQWQVTTGTTPNASTGPTGDHTLGNGKYVYTEATNGLQGDLTFLTSPCIDISGLSVPQMTFWYHMYGANIDALFIDVFDGGTWVENVFNITSQQQTSNADDWLQAIVNLSAYTSLDKIRFRTLKGNGYDGDIAIDDISIGEAPLFDIAVIELVEPFSGCGLTANENITINIVNMGAITQDTIALAYSIDGGTTIVGPEYYYPAINPGDTATFTFSTQADFSVPGIYDVSSFITDTSDNNNFNDSVFATLESSIVIDVFPHLENFENFITGSPGTFVHDWVNEPITGYRWQVNSGTTSSSNTGPTIDHTLGTSTGIYVYTEASSGALGDFAYITSPCLDLSSMTAPKLSFWYHMYGSTIDTIFIDVLIGGVWIENIYNIVGQQQATSTDDWLEAIVDLIPYYTLEKIRFRARRGSSYYGDISIDDVKIYEPLPNDLNALSWNSPLGYQCVSSAEDIVVEIYNEGIDYQFGYDVSYSIDGGTTFISETITDTIYAGDTLVYTFATQADFSVSGNYNCIFIVSNTGDMNNLNDTIYVTVDFFAIQIFPFVEDFETSTTGTPGIFPNHWSSYSNSTYEWYVDNGGTPTINTGPASDHTTGSSSGIYVYTEASNGVSGDTAILYLPCVDIISYTNPALNFWYHMYGSTIDTLYIDVFVGTSWINGIYAIGGEHQTASTDPWLMAQVDLTPYISATEIRFRAIKDSDYGDIAIDDINVYEPYIDIGVVEISGPISSCSFTIMSHIIVKVENFGTLTISSGDTIPVALEFNGSPAIVEPFVLPSDLTPGNSQFYMFSGNYDLTTIGNYDIAAYTLLIDDSDNSNDTTSGVISHYGNPVVDLGPNIITAQPDTVVLDAGTGFSTYLWQDASSSQTFNVSIEAWYYVTVTDNNGCTANDSVYVGNSLSVELLSGTSSSLTIYPNPNYGIFIIDAKTDFTTDWIIEMINVQGQLIYQIKIDDVRAFNKTIDVSGFAQGLYYIKVNNGKELIIEKIVIK